MSDLGNLAAFLDEGWRHLQQGVADSQSPARYPTFATVSPEGLPEARTVALRHAAQAEAVVEVHTDILTPKVKALKASPRAAIHVWIPRSQVQIRLTTTAEILTGKAAEDAWVQVPPTSRVSYGTMPDPGTPIKEVFGYKKPPVRDRFAVLHCRVDHIDLVHLGERHRRAEYVRSDGWRGTWLAP
ncbi:pyridoxamine 5'-phosphate oxidase family protein [uncultured Tateyamaria sp.]|uniref:pyridoxamine 5'-phosphate oxidase family protein n=1 Tax=uncultured Tateyamaria sp. TaxID=455651 RepID=UPI00261ABB3B|nr:pyridoxamine 5'-phosphate oxidase family protein [uncultured Tateyamaria sp.]